MIFCKGYDINLHINQTIKKLDSIVLHVEIHSLLVQTTDWATFPESRLISREGLLIQVIDFI